MLRDSDRAYAALNEQLQDAIDDECRLRALGETDEELALEFVSARERVQGLVQRISAMLEPARV